MLPSRHYCRLGRGEGGGRYQDISHVVIALPAHRANTQPVAVVALQLRHGHVVAAGDGDAVVLVVDRAAADNEIGAAANVEAVRVMCGGEAAAASVRRVAGCVVEQQVFED